MQKKKNWLCFTHNKSTSSCKNNWVFFSIKTGHNMQHAAVRTKQTLAGSWNSRFGFYAQLWRHIHAHTLLSDSLLIVPPFVCETATRLSYLPFFILLFACCSSQCGIHLVKLLGCSCAAVWDQVGVRRPFIFSVSHMANSLWPDALFFPPCEHIFNMN